MTPSPPLSAAELARILTEEQLQETEKLQHISDGLRWNPIRQIIASHRLLSVRLAEAEWEVRQLKEIGGYRDKERLMFESGLTEAKGTIADLRAQLATLRADHAATVAELATAQATIAATAMEIEDRETVHNHEIDLGNSDLATERAARVEAEGEAAEMRTALESIVKTLDPRGLARSACECRACQGYRLAEAALATPSGSGAAAVLAAADHYETIRAKRLAVLDESVRSAHPVTTSFREIDKEMMTASNGLREAVAAWRVARGEGGAAGD